MSARASVRMPHGATARPARSHHGTATAPAARPRPRAVAGRRARPRARLRLGRMVIPLIALLLMGVVWVNVAKLNLTTQAGQVVRHAEQVQAQTAELQARLVQRDGSVRARAAAELGMEDAAPNSRQYLAAPAVR